MISLYSSQETKTVSFKSDILNETRKLSIHLPASIEDSTSNDCYSLIVVLDADFLFYPVVGTVEAQYFRGLIPKTIVIGIHQNELTDKNVSQRWQDCDYDANTGKLTQSGLNFKAFITEEIITYIENEYSISTFKSIVGHSFTANYLNYFLMDELSPFKGYAAFSPFIPTTIESDLLTKINRLTVPNYYFLSTADQDLSGHLHQIEKQDSSLFLKASNEFFNYNFEKYTDKTHMSLPLRSCTPAIDHLFSGYQPLYYYGDKFNFPEEHLCDFLKKRYDAIKSVYGCELKIREEDLMEIAWRAEEKGLWEELNEIGNLSIKLYPKSVYGYYTKATFYEYKKDYVNALRYYKEGYLNLGDDILNKQDFYVDIERVEELIKQKK